MALSPLLAASVALVPGVHAWWTGRALLARTSDPAFPEMLLAWAQRRTAVFVVAGAVVVVLAVQHWMWTMPLLLLGGIVGGFSFRRALFGETWGLADYARYSILSVVASAGFWVLLAFAPQIVLALVHGWTPDRPLAGAAAFATLLAAGLLTWELGFARVWVALHRATPLERPDLQPRLDEIVRRAGARPPRVFRYGARGGYVMNAVALPSTRQPGVAFGDSLLELLDADEVTAVFAHEIAHLEHYHPGRLHKLRLITWSLVFGGMILPPILMATLPTWAATVAVMWPMLVLGVLLHRISASQAHEAESDRRSAELVGDPEPMIRALTKLHHYSRLPRRWPYDFERSASHPSLARRIQSLRATSGVTPSTFTEPVVLRSTEPGSYVVLDATRIYWFEGVPAASPSPDPSPGLQPAGDDAHPPTLADLREHATSYRATTYADLAELRVAVAGTGRTLHARDRAGRISSVPLRAEDVAAAQGSLDRLDGQLAARAQPNWRSSARKVAAVAALVAVASLDFGWTWIPLLLALAFPSAWSLGALGMLMTARAVASALEGVVSPIGQLSWVVTTLAITIGVAALVVAWRWAASADPRRNRRLAQVALVSAAALLFIGAQAYGARAASLDWAEANAEVITRIGAEGHGFRVQLSPHGRHVAIQTIDPTRRSSAYDDEDGYNGVAWRFTVADATGGAAPPPRTIEALGLMFLDERRALVLRTLASPGDSLVITAEDLQRDSVVTWQRRLPPLAGPTLSVDQRTGRWSVIGHDRDVGEVVIVRGSVDSDSLVIARESYAVLGGRPLSVSADGTILSATVNIRGGIGRGVLAGFGILPYHWEIWRAARGERERIGTVPGNPECTPDGRGNALLCIVSGTRGMSVWRIEDGRTLAALGTLPREFHLWRVGATGHVVGSRLAPRALATVDVGARRATRLALPDSSDGPGRHTIDAAMVPGVVAALTSDKGRSEVTLYRVR